MIAKAKAFKLAVDSARRPLKSLTDYLLLDVPTGRALDIEKRVKAILKRFTFVRWDRFVTNRSSWSLYGWIKRGDAYEDFLVLDFSVDVNGVLETWWLTSSKRYDAKIKNILHTKGTSRCKRVEHYFDIPNAIRLPERQH